MPEMNSEETADAGVAAFHGGMAAHVDVLDLRVAVMISSN
jgi:hypothetical protein